MITQSLPICIATKDFTWLCIATLFFPSIEPCTLRRHLERRREAKPSLY
eukprot:jgi/Mesvir1/7463/Mv25816-RA.1